ncbi:MAG TPA: CGNR zinc finger domain-containing protein [Dehalococcoidia bacterium]|nr:CGNR zinc finger domain-containing protein [Dehalococcoidia bacterium]
MVTKAIQYAQLTDEHAEDPRTARQSAPGALSLVLDFVRTSSFLDDSANLRDWLRAQGLMSTKEELAAGEARSLIDLRQALRALLRANHDRTANGEALKTLDLLSSQVAMELRFRDDQASLQARDGRSGQRAIGQILGIVYDAMADGSWQRMKICRASDCQWAFYDSSRNRSGTWCSMSDCGNRAKARAFRERSRTTQR